MRWLRVFVMLSDRQKKSIKIFQCIASCSLNLHLDIILIRMLVCNTVILTIICHVLFFSTQSHRSLVSSYNKWARCSTPWRASRCFRTQANFKWNITPARTSRFSCFTQYWKTSNMFNYWDISSSVLHDLRSNLEWFHSKFLIRSIRSFQQDWSVRRENSTSRRCMRCNLR